MIRYIYLLILFVSMGLMAQSSPEEYQLLIKKYRNIDYLNYPYKYITDDYTINISDEMFNKLLVENKFYPEKITKYKDSLSVVLCGEFDNWAQVNLAHHTLTMTWLRVSYYLWISEEETEILGKKYSFNMPYAFYKYLYEDQHLWDTNMVDFINNLRKKVYRKTKNEEVYSMETKKLLNYSLVENPVRIEDFERLKSQKKGMTEGCGKPDCCQLEGSSREKCENEEH